MVQFSSVTKRSKNHISSENGLKIRIFLGYQSRHNDFCSPLPKFGIFPKNVLIFKVMHFSRIFSFKMLQSQKMFWICSKFCLFWCFLLWKVTYIQKMFWNGSKFYTLWSFQLRKKWLLVLIGKCSNLYCQEEKMFPIGPQFDDVPNTKSASLTTLEGKFVSEWVCNILV